MKKFLTGAAVIGVLFLVSGCASGPVNDKRAPGDPGHKTFEIQIREKTILGPDDVWVRVSERVWGVCDIDTEYPECAG